MSLKSARARDSHPPPAVPARRFTVDEYHRMGEAGVLTEDDRVELLEGWIVSKMIHNPRHDATIDHVHEVMRRRLPRKWRIRIQSAITTGDSEPEPDLAIVPGPPSLYALHHPLAKDVALAIEVADTSLDHDRGLKSRLYARGRVPIYWIINLVDRVVEVHENPSGSGGRAAYKSRQFYRLKQSVPLVLERGELAKIPVKALIGL
jgi:hypothetical protein